MSGGPPRSDYYGHGGPPPPRGSGGYHRGPPPPYERGPPPRSYRDRERPRDRHRPYPPRGGPPRGRRGRHSPPRNTHTLITFRSYEEEQAWVEERRRKRKERPTKFDCMPTPEQQLQQQHQKAALLTLDAASIHPTTPVNAQQTRHARRLYIGNLPPMMSEAQIQQVFTDAIRTALVSSDNNNNINVHNDPNPILNVYMHNERRFCFIEFKTVEMTTACMALDGLMVQGQTLKVKRPNDYNALAAPKIHPSSMPELDVSRLGIISRTVVDGPNKIFIGGLHYHLQEHQVMELLSAFGKIKAFHLVKNDPADINSKGYCFVEYADPAVTPIAVEGLNGMDIGGGKSLTARLAGERSGGPVIASLPTMATAATAAAAAAAVAAGTTPAALATSPSNLAVAATATAAPGPNNSNGMPPPNHTIVAGYDIEALVDAAMGIAPMPPMTPQYVDALGVPLTRVVPPVLMAAAAGGAAAAAPATPMTLTTAVPPAAMSVPTTTLPTGAATAGVSRVLVLHNMVTDEDLATPEDRQALIQEVREECEKFGIVEKASLHGYKIYLMYAEMSQALAAGRELKGREFAERAVDCSYVTEEEFQRMEE
jgi:hypothetical protein